MNSKSLKKVKRELFEMRASPTGLKGAQMAALAKKLGRTKSKRGKEPTYIRNDSPELNPPLSIPQHAGKDLKIGTARSIIDTLLSDVDDWGIHLNAIEDE